MVSENHTADVVLPGFSREFLQVTTDYQTIEISYAWKRFMTFLVLNLFQASEFFYTVPT